MRNLFISLILIFTVTALAIPQTTKGTFVAKGQGVVRRAAAGGGGGSFPVNGIIDNFNRANEGPPLSASWLDRISSADGSCEVVSNEGSCIGASDHYTTDFGSDMEVYSTDIPTIADAQLFARIQSAGGTSANSYSLYRLNSTTLQVYERVSGTFTQIGADITVTTANGDGLGFSVVGTTLKSYHLPSGGAWTLVDTRTGTNVTGAGKIGIAYGVFNDFGGGAL